MFDRLPPVQTLRAFEATARHLSMSKAALELCLTHGAVSKSIKILEADLKVNLFHRSTRKITLTDAGLHWYRVVAQCLGDLTREAERLRAPDRDDRLRISTSISFASKWLGPRLHRLKALHPQLDIHLDVTDVNVDVNGGYFDAAIRYGPGRYDSAIAERLMTEEVSPVCSPSFLAHHGGLPTPEDLVQCNLMHEDRMLANWFQWFAKAGVVWRGREGAAFSHGSLAIDAAIRGEGVALARSVLVADDVAAGRLVVLFPQHALKAERGYDLVYGLSIQSHIKLSWLRNWLRTEVDAFFD